MTNLARKAVLLCAAATIAIAIGSQSAGAETPDRVMIEAEAYVSGKGFAEIDLETRRLSEELDATLVDIGLARRDADITALEKALLLIDLTESPLPRVRYAVRLSQQSEGAVPISLVEVYRFNLGPAVRTETADAYGEENTADAEEFGVGPHVAWRFAMQPSTKAAAILLAAGRKEITEAEAAEASCFGRKCLSLDTADDLKSWEDAQQPPGDLPDLPYAEVLTTGDGDDRYEEEAPAGIALAMAVAMGLATADADGVIWTVDATQPPTGSSPYMALVIDRNIGQEIMTDAIMGVAKTRKDNEERWLRRTGGVFDGTVSAYFQTATGPM